jgi:putative ABC transport system permease protein
MIRNYLKIAWRNLVKNKAHSFINITGLSVGMAVVMLIGLWIYDELSFNKNFKNYNRIAQVMQHFNTNGDIGTGSTVPSPMGDELRKSFGSDFKYITMASWNGGHILTSGNKKLTKDGAYLEPQALEMLSVTMLKGTKSGLNDPSSILLSESAAKAYFGDANPMDKLMKIDNKLNVKVTGVYEDLPDNSSFADIKFIAPWELFSTTNELKKQADTWRCNCYMAYAQIADNADINKVSAKIRDLKLSKVNKSELKQKPQVFLQPMSKWHLYADFKNGVNTGGRIQYVWMFGIIGIFVLLLACINFINLSTARSEKRAKEVGIRKAIGSLRTQLIWQFLSESLLIAAFAFALAIVLVLLALPFFNEMADKKMSILWGNPVFWLAGICFSLFSGIISGSYPALYLSSFQPVKVLKGTFKVGKFAAIPRKVLVVLQFTVSVTLIIGTIIVFRQIQFAKNRPIGYSRNGLITLSILTNNVHNQFAAVKDELLKTGAITAIAEAGSPTTDVWSTNSGFDWRGKDPELSVEFPNIDVSYDYGKTVGWQFKEGRGFSKEFPTDSQSFVLNETAVKYMGLKNPVGEIIKWDGAPFKVIGVIKDMLVESPYEPVRPSLFHLTKDQGNVVILRINPKESASEALGKIETVFKTYNPEQPFEYQFADEEYAKKFGNEERIGKLASCFAILAIFISCLGLFGMASFMAEQRIKEIGVRKVLGASIFNLWGLLSKDFVLLVIISILIATPTAYYFMHGWLQNYTYRSNIAWWIFAVTALGAMLITLLTVSYQSIKAALANPVKSLNRNKRKNLQQ